MCGIVGIVALDPGHRVDPARVSRMRDVLRHRGPDDAGLWSEGPAGLGSRRLSIVDVNGGHQPMSSADGRVWIAYNGEVYNHPSLRAEIEATGRRYRTKADTESILHLYQRDGDACVERLQGMFAFAIWDRDRRRLLLARDRLGIKPLYYALTDRELLFASEIKGILAAGSIRPELNEDILPEFLANRFVPGEETFFRGVRKLLPGRTLSWSRDEGPRIRRGWRLGTASNGNGRLRSLREEAFDLRERLEETVRAHLMSDVPLGLFLSGGIDSSALAALTARVGGGERLRTFAVGFDDPGASEPSELGYARLAARTVGAEHREVLVTPEDFFGALPRLVWHEDEPLAFPSSVPLYFVSRLAREHVKVVLSGEGADELFLGYNRYRVTLWNERLSRLYRGLAPGALRRTVASLVDALPASMRRYGERTFLKLEPGPRGLFFENFAVFPYELQARLFVDPSRLERRDPYAELLRCYESAAGGALDRMGRTDLETYLVELLMKQDQMSMAASVEARVPYLDHRLVEHVTALPSRMKLRRWTTKLVLREAVRDLVPREILQRRKMGFPTPVGRWLRDGHWRVVEDLVLGSRALERGLFSVDAVRRLAEEHRRGAVNHADRLWLLANLEVWQRVFLDGEALGSVVRVA